MSVAGSAASEQPSVGARRRRRRPRQSLPRRHRPGRCRSFGSGVSRRVRGLGSGVSVVNGLGRGAVGGRGSGLGGGLGRGAVGGLGSGLGGGLGRGARQLRKRRSREPAAAEAVSVAASTASAGALSAAAEAVSVAASTASAGRLSAAGSCGLGGGARSTASAGALSAAAEAVSAAVSAAPETASVAPPTVSVAPEGVGSWAEALAHKTAKTAPSATKKPASRRRLGRPSDR